MKILVLSSHTPSLFWFRVDMMKAFQARGVEVIAVGPDSDAKWTREFGNIGIEYRNIPVSRNGLNVFADLKTYSALRKLFREIKPDKIFTYQAKTIVYGSLAAGSKCEIYPLVAGLGSIFRGKGLKNRLIKTILSLQYTLAFKRAKTVIFQNTDDRDSLVSLGLLPKDKTAIVNGSGVNTQRFTFTSLPTQKAILYVGRLIGDKGVREYLGLAKRLYDKNAGIRCLLVGPFDSNPSALKPEELQPFIDSGIVEYFGEQKDVRPYMEQSTVYVLPSYHEGTPKTVLEAMAMGRPIVTTNAPGCRETVENGVNGFLIPVRDVDDLETSVCQILDSPDIAKKYGIASRKIAEKKYDVNKVNESIINIMNI